MTSTVAVGLFGLLGVFSRYALDRMVPAPGNGFPLSTFLVNVFGCLLVGVIFSLAERQILSPQLSTALMVGFCGGFTTFSAYVLQSLTLYDRARFGMGLLYLVLSPLAGLLAALLPIFLSRRFFA